jgi:hypothetical protein
MIYEILSGFFLFFGCDMRNKGFIDCFVPVRFGEEMQELRLKAEQREYATGRAIVSETLNPMALDFLER